MSADLTSAAAPVQGSTPRSTPMRVLFVINSLVMGGAETLVCEIARELATSQGAQVMVATLYPQTGEAWRLVGSGVQVATLGLSHKRELYKGARRLRALVRSFRPDVVHGHLFPTSLYVALALAGLRRMPATFFSEHGEDNNRRAHAWFQPVDAVSYRIFKRVLCVSVPTRDALAAWIPGIAERLVVVPNAVSIPTAPWNARGPFEQELVYVGRLEVVKGVDVLLHALALLRAEGRAPTLKVVGEGSLAAPLEQLAAELRLAEQVRFVGRSSDVERHMRESRVVVLPSRSEGMSMVMLEAMALGMPVVATAVGGAGALVGDPPVAGALALPEDPASLAASLVAMLDDPARQAACGREARRRVEGDYSLGEYVRKLYEMYAEVAGRTSPRAARG